MVEYSPVREVWSFESTYCRNPQAWIEQALNLRGNLEALILYDDQVKDCLFNKKKQPPLKAFWTAGVMRMLIGFSLENLVKAVILKDSRKADQAFSKEGNLRWAVPSHDLPKLFAEAGVQIDDENLVLIELWTASATWAGRYPLPMNENKLPKRRKPASSREELIKRRSRQIQKAMKSGERLRPDQFDFLHGGVGTLEIELYRKIFDELRTEFGEDVFTDFRIG